MLGRKKKTENELQTEQAAANPQREGAKNRPTPKRRDQEAARKRPLVQNNPRELKRMDRAKRREESAKMRQAMVTGDEKHLPPRDKGPVRRFVRDNVDARFNLGELLLLLMLAVLVLSVLAPRIATYFFLGVYILSAAAIIDAILTWKRTKKKILAKFGEGTELRGLALYSVMRSFQMRRTRMPRPMVERGTKVT